MTIVNFYDEVDDALLRFAVIIATSEGKYVFCKHKARNTCEVPGGHREAGEMILDTAKRELYEETGIQQKGLDRFCTCRHYWLYGYRNTPFHSCCYLIYRIS